jgi:hypothetical protein
MVRMLRSLTAVLAVFGLLSITTAVPAPAATKTLTAAEAAQHAGEVATVCGVVASAKFASSTKGQPTYLNLDKPYPNQIFTVLIWGENRAAFGTPEKDLDGKRVCVTGKIALYRGKPEIVVHLPSELTKE